MISREISLVVEAYSSKEMSSRNWPERQLSDTVRTTLVPERQSQREMENGVCTGEAEFAITLKNKSA